MNRIIILCFALLGAGIIWAQDAPKKKVAVYVAGGKDEGVKKILGAQLVSAIVSNGTYQAIERTSEFLTQIKAEQKYQQSGNVDDNQLSKLGKQMGVNYVCVADVTDALGSTFIQARLIDVENANIINTGEDDGKLEDMASLKKIANAITSQLLGSNGSASLLKNSIAPKSSTASTLSFTANGVPFEMVKVEGGSFTMGCTSEQGSDCYDNEKPAHQENISTFYIGKYEVTQGLWKAVMGNNPSYFKNGDNFPVEQVSWDDCQEFIRRLNQLTGEVFALPTEAQWEYAARGGNRSMQNKYAGSNTLENVGWYDGNASSSTHAVGRKQPNELGIYDMSGNVWEWCYDCWRSNYNSSSGSYRVLRGGSWNSSARYCRVAFRGSNTPSYRGGGSGFRLSLVQ